MLLPARGSGWSFIEAAGSLLRCFPALLLRLTAFVAGPATLPADARIESTLRASVHLPRLWYRASRCWVPGTPSIALTNSRAAKRPCESIKYAALPVFTRLLAARYRAALLFPLLTAPGKGRWLISDRRRKASRQYRALLAVHHLPRASESSRRILLPCCRECEFFGGTRSAFPGSRFLQSVERHELRQ